MRYNWFYTDTTRASIYYNSAKTPLQPTWINQSTAYVEESNWWAHLSNEAPESNQITCIMFQPKRKSINQPTWFGRGTRKQFIKSHAACFGQRWNPSINPPNNFSLFLTKEEIHQLNPPNGRHAKATNQFIYIHQSTHLIGKACESTQSIHLLYIYQSTHLMGKACESNQSIHLHQSINSPNGEGRMIGGECLIMQVCAGA